MPWNGGAPGISSGSPGRVRSARSTVFSRAPGPSASWKRSGPAWRCAAGGRRGLETRPKAALVMRLVFAYGEVKRTGVDARGRFTHTCGQAASASVRPYAAPALLGGGGRRDHRGARNRTASRCFGLVSRRPVDGLRLGPPGAPAVCAAVDAFVLVAVREARTVRWK